eukprot:COSAG02_NODE_11503_length_1711_cov_1.552109_1_plen_138_part_01
MHTPAPPDFHEVCPACDVPLGAKTTVEPLWVPPPVGSWKFSVESHLSRRPMFLPPNANCNSVCATHSWFLQKSQSSAFFRTGRFSNFEMAVQTHRPTDLARARAVLDTAPADPLPAAAALPPLLLLLLLLPVSCCVYT